ncbi:MAG: class I SAM-dependent methyltransferase [Myxococcales bacterium]|nr:class I SAM-dependent methyltransferase [Myxococcales bacterium]
MDTDSWQIVRNRFHTYGSPVSVAKMERVFDLLDLPPRARVLDVGCGKGEALIRLVERFEVRAVGVDPSPVLLLARDAATQRVSEGDVTWHGCGVDELDLEDEAFDLTICMGSHHAFGSYEDMLDAMIRLTRPGGALLVGEGFWQQPPPQAYLEALGTPSFHQNSHAGNLDAAEERGLWPVYSVVSSRDEWDEFEWLYQYAMNRHAREHGLSVEQEHEVAARRRFVAAQQRWGRDAMGFAVYLFRTPSAS